MPSRSESTSGLAEAMLPRRTPVSEIVRYLIEKGVAGADVLPAADSDAFVTHVADLEAAQAGALCWMSKRRYDADASQADAFKGALLIAPAGARGEQVLPCKDPKLAFVLAASFVVAAHGETEWATAGSPGAKPARVAPSARLAPGVFIGSDVMIEDDVIIGPNSCLQHVTIARGSSIGANCSIGGPGFGLVWGGEEGWLRFPHVGRVEIESNVEIGSNTCVDRGALGDTRIRRGARIDNLVHIAHNADIGEGALVIANAMVAGSATIGERAWIAPSASIMNQLTIGAAAVVGLGAVVVKSVEAGATVVGNPAKPLAPREPTERKQS